MMFDATAFLGGMVVGLVLEVIYLSVTLSRLRRLWWKHLATCPNPAFHARNAVSNAWLRANPPRRRKYDG
jgi:hypothetical protein